MVAGSSLHTDRSKASYASIFGQRAETHRTGPFEAKKDTGPSAAEAAARMYEVTFPPILSYCSFVHLLLVAFRIKNEQQHVFYHYPPVGIWGRYF